MFSSKNTTQLLIGKDISRTSNVQITDEATASTFIKDGEILVLGENHDVLVSGSATVTDSPSITIVQGRGAGKGLKFSNKINGKDVIRATAASYAAPANQVSYVGYNTSSGSIDVQPYTDYKLTILFTHDTDMYAEQHVPRTYYYTTGASDTQATVAAAFVTMINADEFYGVVAASVNSGANYGIRLTGQNLDFIVGQYKYNKMRFEVLLSGFGTTAVTLNTAASLGVGTYEQIAELEWFVNGFDGVINRVHFPAPTGTTDAVSGETYDVIAIEHYLSDENYAISGTKPARALTMIAVPDTAGQGDTGTESIIPILNEWLASAMLPFAGLAI